MCSETQFRLGLMCESLMRALGVLLCACVRYSCKLSFYCDCLLTFIRLDTPEYTEPRSTLNMAMSVSKLIEEGGEPGRLLTGHLFAVRLLSFGFLVCACDGGVYSTKPMFVCMCYHVSQAAGVTFGQGLWTYGSKQSHKASET